MIKRKKVKTKMKFLLDIREKNTIFKNYIPIILSRINKLLLKKKFLSSNLEKHMILQLIIKKEIKEWYIGKDLDFKIKSILIYSNH